MGQSKQHYRSKLLEESNLHLLAKAVTATGKKKMKCINSQAFFFPPKKCSKGSELKGKMGKDRDNTIISSNSSPTATFPSEFN